MKKLLFILAAVVLAVGCTDKPEYNAPGTSTPQVLELVYDTAQITSADKMFDQTLNRVDDIYRVNGQYVKFTMYLAQDGVFYLTTSALIDDDEEAIADGKMLDCEIVKVDGNYSNPTQVNFKAIADDEYTWQADLPEAEVEKEPAAEQPENVTIYEETPEAHPAYVVRYKDSEGVVKFGFVFTVESIVLTQTVTLEEMPSGKPYVDPTLEEVYNFNNSVTLLYKAFDENGNWLN
jgi:hypothetical protein